MGSGHSHGASPGQSEKPLWIALALTSLFLTAELVGGILTNSLALISDAAHMFTDAAALAISLVALRIGRRPADGKRTFGYYRFEILAAALNAMLLFMVALYIIYEAYKRLQSPPEIESTGMLIIAAIGLVVNLISMRLLRAGKDSSLNMKGAYLEVWSDMLGSVGVIVGAVLIRYTGWGWLDSVIAVGIGLWVLPRTLVLLRESMNVLLEGVPEGVGIAEISSSICAIPGVASIHDLHVWSISSGKTSLSVHVVSADATLTWPTLVSAVRDMLAKDFEIRHTTVQVEDSPCEQSGAVHEFLSPVPVSREAHDH